MVRMCAYPKEMHTRIAGLITKLEGYFHLFIQIYALILIMEYAKSLGKGTHVARNSTEIFLT